MGRVEQVTRAIRSHDRELYCERNREGILCIYRKGHRIETYDYQGSTLLYARPAPHFVFALTEDWKANSKARDWGILPILKRLNDIDLWKHDLASEIEKNQEEHLAKKERRASSRNEDFLKEFRKPFAKAFNDVNVASMNKKESRRLRDGNFK